MSEERTRRLPNSWKWVKLSELGSWKGGGTPSKSRPEFWNGGTIPWVSPKDMKTARIRDAEDHITEEALENSATNLIAPGSVLIVTRSGILERTLPVAVCEVPVTINQDLKAVTPISGIEPHYLAAALRAFEQEILHACSKSGTTVASIEFPSLLQFEIPLAPLREQGRIIKEIEKLFTELDVGVTALYRVQANLKRYRASVLKAACEGRLVPTEADLARAEGREYEPADRLLERLLKERRERWNGTRTVKDAVNGTSNREVQKGAYPEPPLPEVAALPKLPDGWCWASVDAVGDVLLGRQRAPQYLTGRFSRPYLRVANIKDDALDLSDVETMDFDEGHFEKYSLRPGDILVSEGQSPELVGQSAIYRGGVQGLCFQKTLHRFRSVPGGPSAEYAQLVFRAHVKNGVFRRLASITTNIAHLTLEKFKASPFPLPPLAEQKRIVSEAERMLTLANVVDATISAQMRRASTLRQAVLRRAFEGKLVPQDPNDEPASVLLDRIRRERASSRPEAPASHSGPPKQLSLELERSKKSSPGRRRPTKP